MACQCQKEIADLKDFIKRWFVLVNRRFDDQEKNFFDQNKKLNEIHSYVFQLIENQQTKKSSTFSFDEVVPNNEINNTDVSMYEKQTLDYAQPHSGDSFVNSIINIENIKVESADFHSAISVIESIDSSDNEIPVPGLSGFHGYQSATFRNNDNICENQLIAESFDYLTNAATNSSIGVAQETHRETGTNYSQKVDPVYEYFKLNENNPGSRCLVKGCKYDGKGRNVTTMKRHLESKHPTIFEEYKAKRKKAENSLTSKKQETSRGQQVLTNLFPVNVKTSYPWKSARAQELRKMLAYLIGVSNVPVTIVNDFAFVEFCSALDSKFQLPKSLQTVRSCIFHLEEEMKMQVRERLSRTQSVSIILDIWSQFGMNRRFLGICASFHDAKYPYPIVAGLAIKELPCPLIAGSIQELVTRVLNEFNIPESKVLRYVTDNGANVVAAFKRNVLVEDEISEEIEENSSALVNVFCGIEEDEQSDDGDQLDLDNDVENDTISNELRNFPQCLSSLDYHLILASDAAFSKKNFKILKDQVQEFVNRCAQSENATLLLQKLAKKKLLDSAPTRWLSFYFVAARVLELKETYIAFAKDMHWPIIFSWDLLTESKDLMKPLFDAVTFLEGDRYSTAPFVIPIILDLKARYSEIKTSFFQESVCELIKQLDNRFDHFITPSSETWDPTYLLSTMMHPGQSQVLPRHLFDCGVAELKHFVRLSNFEDVVANVLSSESGIQSANEDFPLLQLKQRTISTEKRVETPSVAVAECEDYLRRLSTMSFAAKLDIIEFWKCSEFAALAPAFFSFLSIPATSASVERLFSAASLSTTGKQIRSGGAFLESQALLRFNRVFISF